METVLTTLFDYQKFEDNPALRSIINATHSRYDMRELNLDEMDCIAAAGMPTPKTKENPK